MLPQLVQRSATPAPGFIPNRPLWPQSAPENPAIAAAIHGSELELGISQRNPGIAHDAWAPPHGIAGPTAPHPSQPQASSVPDGYPRTVTPPYRHTDPSIPALPVLMGFLVSFDGNDLGRFWPLHQGQILLGRAQTTDNLDITIEHNTTSARHAQLVALARPSRLSIQDLGSTNGTYVNDHRLTPGQPQLAAHGDRLRFGGYNVIVVLIA